MSLTLRQGRSHRSDQSPVRRADEHHRRCRQAGPHPGQQMAEHPCAGLYAITADMEFESHYGKRANKRRKMYNGMIPCQLYMYYEAPKFEHKAKPMPKQGFDGKRTAEFKKK